MDELALEWQDRFNAVWDPDGKGQYRNGSPGQRLAPQFLEYVPRGATINDYGCGTGRPAVRIKQLRPDVKLNLVDIATNALEKEVADLLGPEVSFTVAPLWRLPDRFPVADWGYCIDVLMTVPPEKLDEILSEIARTCRSFFAQVYDWPDIRLGVDYTTIKETPAWWLDQLCRHWRTGEVIQSREHKQRSIFICRE